MVILSRGSTDGGHPILLRTLFESTARLMFIAGSPENNALALERIDCEEMLRQTGKSPIQGEATETTEIRNLVCDRLTDLKKENVKRITFKEILMQGKLARQYPIYQQLCGVVHSQITPLLHNLANYQDKVVSFKLLRPYSEERRKALEEAAIAFLQLAELNIHRALAKLQTPPAANK